MTTLLMVTWGMCGQWGLGLPIALALVGQPSRESSQRIAADRWAELFGLSLLFGIGISAYVSFLWSLCGGQLGRPLSFSLTIAGCVSGLIGWRLSRRGEELPKTLADGDEAAFRRAGVVVVWCLFLFVLSLALLTPQRFWDERTIYGLKAAVLFEDRSVFSPDLLHRDFAQYHPRYPLLIPLAEQHIYALLGEVDDRWSKVLFPVLYLGMLLTFAGVLSRRLRSGAAWLFAVLLGSVPVLATYEMGFLSAQADAVVAAFHLVAVVYLWDWLQQERRDASLRSLLIAAVAASLTIFTKDEGLAFFAIDAALFVPLSVLAVRFHSADVEHGNGRLRWRDVIGSAAGAVALFVGVTVLLTIPWSWHRSRLPTTTEIQYFSRLSLPTILDGLPALGWSVGHLWDRMFREAIDWGLVWWVVLAALAARPRQSWRPHQLFVLGDLLGALTALILAGMIAPTPVEEHLGGSAHRYLMQIAPVALLFVAGQWGRSFSSARIGEPGRAADRDRR